MSGLEGEDPTILQDMGYYMYKPQWHITWDQMAGCIPHKYMSRNGYKQSMVL